MTLAIPTVMLALSLSLTSVNVWAQRWVEVDQDSIPVYIDAASMRSFGERIEYIVRRGDSEYQVFTVCVLSLRAEGELPPYSQTPVYLDVSKKGWLRKELATACSLRNQPFAPADERPSARSPLLDDRRYSHR